MVKGVRQMVDLVPSIRQVHSPGQIRLLPYLLHGVCDPAHRKQGSSDKLVGQEDHHHRKSRQKDEANRSVTVKLFSALVTEVMPRI